MPGGERSLREVISGTDCRRDGGSGGGSRKEGCCCLGRWEEGRDGRKGELWMMGTEGGVYVLMEMVVGMGSVSYLNRKKCE